MEMADSRYLDKYWPETEGRLISHGDRVMLMSTVGPYATVHRVRRAYRRKVYLYCGLVRTIGKLLLTDNEAVNCENCMRNDINAD